VSFIYNKEKNGFPNSWKSVHYNNSTEHAGFAAVITLPASCSGICKDTSQALLSTLTQQARKPVKA
jgi:hypothetical protein